MWLAGPSVVRGLVVRVQRGTLRSTGDRFAVVVLDGGGPGLVMVGEDAWTRVPDELVGRVVIAVVGEPPVETKARSIKDLVCAEA